MKLCNGCGKRPARAAVLNMSYRGSHRFIHRKGHDLCQSCWRNLRNKLRITNVTQNVAAISDATGHP
jgi:hypothetical protein